MCGFAGFVGVSRNRPEGLAILARMAHPLRRRGPDEQGAWLSSDGVIGLVHRRLAVLELGPEGAQPMSSPSGRWVLAYNGELYNFTDLRRELQRMGTSFRAGSDTEVLLAAIETWGVETALARCIGMFAFALWDGRERVLHLARDRFGEKPLYYGWQGASFIFGSDLAALRGHPDFAGGVDRHALSQLVRYNCVPGALCIHPGLCKLLPGTRLELEWCDGRWTEALKTYWSAWTEAATAAATPYRGSEVEAAEIAHHLLRESVRGQMVADVPLGAFLSGGIDSSAVVGVMQSLSERPVQTFTVGFADPAYDESVDASRVAAHLGTLHRSVRLGAEDALAMIPQLADYYSEPFADASQIAALLVSGIARREVTVALSGDGGDELFGGYNRYVWAEAIWRHASVLPFRARRLIAKLMESAPPRHWDAVLGRRVALRQPGEKIHKLATVLGADSPREVHQRLTTFWHDGNPVLNAGAMAFRSESEWPTGHGLTEAMMLADTVNYLPNDILVKVDRAAMGVSLETRAPFLDHRLFEFLWSLPLSFRVRRGGSKMILREILYRYVPRELVERPKAGFALPIHDWLRGPLREWAEAQLDAGRLRREGYFDSALVRRAWDEHLAGRRNRQYDLWSILMFQAWQEAWQR